MGLDLQIRALRESDIEQVKAFTDVTIGKNYYSLSELEEIFKRSRKHSVMCSFVLSRGHEILGVRISYPPGLWDHGKGQGLRPDLWKSPIDQVAYFQSLFIAEALQGQGWGKKMSLAAIEALKKSGAKAVVCHAWCESPNDSSRRYLRSLGFEKVATHPFYWKQVDYVCTRCGKPCLCTADEMIKYL